MSEIKAGVFPQEMTSPKPVDRHRTKVENGEDVGQTNFGEAKASIVSPAISSFEQGYSMEPQGVPLKDNRNNLGSVVAIGVNNRRKFVSSGSRIASSSYSNTEEAYESVRHTRVKMKTRVSDRINNKHNKNYVPRVWGIKFEGVFISEKQLKVLNKSATFSDNPFDFIVCKGEEGKLDLKIARKIQNCYVVLALDAISSKKTHQAEGLSENLSTIYATSYGLIRFMDEGLFPKCLPKSFIMSFLLLISSITSVPTWGAVVMHIDNFISMNSEVNYFKELFAEVIVMCSKEDDTQVEGLFDSILEKLSRPIMEVFSVAVVCRIFGVSSDFADFRDIKMFLKDSLLKFSSNLLETINAIFQIVTSGSFEDFWVRVYAKMGGSQTEFAKLNARLVEMTDSGYEVTKPLFARILDAEELLAEANLYYTKIDVAEGSRGDRQFSVFRSRCNHLLSKLTAERDSTEARKEPLGFMFNGLAGVGKSTGIQMILAAYGTVMNYRPEVVKQMLHVWNNSDKFQEGCNNGKKIYYWDEFSSIKPDIDTNLGSQCAALLQILSAWPAWINMAFEAKGTVTSAGVVGVVVNTNAEIQEITKLFRGQGDNITRRFYHITTVPNGPIEVGGKLKVTSDMNSTILGENMRYEFRKTVVRPGHADEVELVKTGNYFECVEFVAGLFYDRIYGEDKKVSKIFGDLTNYRADLSKIIISRKQEKDNFKESAIKSALDIDKDNVHYAPRTHWMNVRDDKVSYFIVVDSVVKEVDVQEYIDFTNHIGKYKPNRPMSVITEGSSTVAHVKQTEGLYYTTFMTLMIGLITLQFYRMMEIQELLGFTLNWDTWIFFSIPNAVQGWLIRLVTPSTMPIDRMWVQAGILDQVRLYEGARSQGVVSTFLKRFNEVVRDRFNRFCEWCVKNKDNLMLAAGCLTASFVAYKGTKMLISSKSEEKINNQVEGYTMPIVSTVAPDDGVGFELRKWGEELIYVKAINPTAGVVRRLGVTGPNMTINDLEKIRSNYVVLHVLNDSTGMYDRVYATRQENFIKASKHIFRTGQKTYHVQAEDPKIPGSSVELIFKDEEIIFSDSDQVLLPSILPSGITYGVLLAKKSTIRTIQSPSEVIVGARVRMLGFSDKTDQFGTIVSVRNQNYTYLERSWIARVGVVQWDDKSFMTEKGHCGRHYYIVEGNGYSYAGYHVGSSKISDTMSLGEFVIETRSDIEKLIERGKKKDNSVVECLSLDDTPPFYYPPEFELIPEWPKKGIGAYLHTVPGFDNHVLGVVPNQVPLRETEYKKSPFFKKVDRFMQENNMPKYLPAMLKNEIRYDTDMKCNVEVSPFQIGLTRYREKDIRVNYSDLKVVMCGLKKIADKCVQPSKVLTIDESLLGRECMPPVNFKTGANESDPGKKGSFIFEYLEESTGDRKCVYDDRMRTAVNDTFTALLNCKLVASKTGCSLKDEIVEQSKVEKASTRVFEAMSFRIETLFRMFFGDSKKSIHRFLNKIGGAVGINVSSPEFKTRIANAVRARTGEEVEMAIDYSKMDKRVLFLILMCAIEIFVYLTIKCLGFSTEKAKFLARLATCHLCIIRIIDGVVVIGYIGNPSGCFFTVEYNTLINVIYMALVFLMAGITWDEFVATILESFRFYGDDLIGKINKSMLTRMSMDRFSLYMSYLNQKVTGVGAVKGSLEGEFTFLKRRFVDAEGGRVFAALDLASWCKSLLYHRPLVDERADYSRHVGVLLQAWGETFFFEEKYKLQYRNLVRDCVKCLPLEFQNIRFPSDQELLARFDSGDFKVWELVNCV